MIKNSYSSSSINRCQSFDAKAGTTTTTKTDSQTFNQIILIEIGPEKKNIINCLTTDGYHGFFNCSFNKATKGELSGTVRTVGYGTLTREANLFVFLIRVLLEAVVDQPDLI